MATSAQGPSFCDKFRSFYYATENNYHPPVDLSEAALRARGDIAEDDEIPESVRNKEIQAILAQPQTLDVDKLKEYCDVLGSYGWEMDAHGDRPCYYCELGTEDGDTIDTAAPAPAFRTISDRGDHVILSNESRLLKIELNKRIEQVAKAESIRVSVPRDKLIPLEMNGQETELSKKYCILGGEYDFLEKDETIAEISRMPAREQTALASKLCVLIQKVGLARIDLDCFRLTSDGRLSIDTFPCGVLVAEQSAVSKRASIEACARIGLSHFVKEVRAAFGTATAQGGVFRAHIEAVYEEAMRPKLSKWKIALSVLSLGLLPLIYAIISLVQVRAIQSRCQSLNQLRASFNQREASLSSAESADEGLRLIALGESIFSMTEGVPFSHGQSIIDQTTI